MTEPELLETAAQDLLSAMAVLELAKEQPARKPDLGRVIVHFSRKANAALQELENRWTGQPPAIEGDPK